MAKRPLTELEKVLLCNGGTFHTILRKQPKLGKPPRPKYTKTTARNGRGAGRGKDTD
jgi:hypothetical protein